MKNKYILEDSQHKLPEDIDKPCNCPITKNSKQQGLK
jgi:hypothetical protein